MTIKRLQQKGFTLIELIVAVVIVGILSAVIYPKFQSMVSNANIGILSGAVGAGQSAAAIGYAQNHGVYPTSDNICSLMNYDAGFSCANGVITVVGAATPTSCIATYDQITGTFTTTTSGC